MAMVKVVGVDVVERHPIAYSDRDEGTPLWFCQQPQDVGQELGRLPLIPRRDDGVVKLDAHPPSPFNIGQSAERG
jgi:hypothetical protein